MERLGRVEKNGCDPDAIESARELLRDVSRFADSAENDLSISRHQNLDGLSGLDELFTQIFGGGSKRFAFGANTSSGAAKDGSWGERHLEFVSSVQVSEFMVKLFTIQHHSLRDPNSNATI